MVDGAQVGLRAPISADCPAGLMTLIIQCWRGDPGLRIDANEALTLACKPSLLAPFVCKTWPDIVCVTSSRAVTLDPGARRFLDFVSSPTRTVAVGPAWGCIVREGEQTKSN